MQQRGPLMVEMFCTTGEERPPRGNGALEPQSDRSIKHGRDWHIAAAPKRLLAHIEAPSLHCCCSVTHFLCPSRCSYRASERQSSSEETQAGRRLEGS
ncbi:hypothetical protein EYF80_046010 [Liparis tanakae]|uniref:Uncharacterized protein n=1 Tax=Liparis tanakae TaxID=230148 RepID=A0A4Z2FSR7_9TELE|nr:hypothetical protein EYF80_046010 [Liparis tanakae]